MRKIFLEKCLLNLFFYRTFPYNDAFATLGRKNRTCHITAPLVLTWHTQLFVTVHILCLEGEGERERALDMATISL
jgi:hypothetical protein